LAPWTERRRRALARAARGAALAGALAVPGTAALAQDDSTSFFQRLYLDRLHLTAVGAGVGAVRPSQTLATQLYELHADYGEVVPHWRVVFLASYWGTRYRDDVVDQFRDSLRRAVVDPTGDDTLRVGRVTVSDIAVSVNVRYTPHEWRHLRPYVGAGLAAHVINAEGRLIDGTFIENALDAITSGLAASAGVSVPFARHLALELQARYDLLSGFRYGSVRAGATYEFSRRRPEPAPPPAAAPAPSPAPAPPPSPPPADGRAP
jgi:opacity protein-like surface antigen